MSQVRSTSVKQPTTTWFDPRDPSFRGDPTYYVLDHLDEERAGTIVSVREVIRLDDRFRFTTETVDAATRRVTQAFTRDYMCAPAVVRTEFWSRTWDKVANRALPSRMTTPDQADKIAIRAFGPRLDAPSMTDPTWRVLTEHQCVPRTYGPAHRTGYVCSCGFDKHMDYPPSTMGRWRLHLHQMLAEASA